MSKVNKRQTSDKTDSPKMNIHEEYLQYHSKYTKKYGSKTIILMQVGSFHECYSTETRGLNLFAISELLNIVCTRKDKSIDIIDETNPYMLGFPSVALNKFLKILIDNQFTVVVIDQVTPAPDPKREITGIYSPSTYVENITTETKYLMTIFIEINNSLSSTKQNISIGMSACDITTAQVFWYEAESNGLINENEAWEETQRFYHYFRPVELVIYQIDKTSGKNINAIENKINLNDKIDILPNQTVLNFSKIHPDYERISYQNAVLKKIYPECGSESPIEFLDLTRSPYAIIALINSFEYIKQHNENLIKDLKKPIYFNNHKYMILGNNAQYQLNVIDYYNWDKLNSKFNSLNSVVNNCNSPMGRRVLKQRLCAPFTDSQTIQYYYTQTEKFLEYKIWEEIRTNIKGIADLDKLFRKLIIKYIHPYELFIIYESLQNLVRIIQYILKSQFKKDFRKMFPKSKIDLFISSINQLENTYDISKLKANNLIEIKESFYKPTIYPDVDLLEDQISNGIGIIEKIAKAIEDIIPDITLSIKHNEKGGYYLFTTNNKAKKLEQQLNAKKSAIVIDNLTIEYTDLIFTYQKNTCKISYSYLKSHSEEIGELYEQLDKKLKEYFISDTTTWFNAHKQILTDCIDLIVQLDLISNNCFNCVNYHYTKPILHTDSNSFINSINIRHPIIEQIIDYEYVPHNITIDEQTHGNLLYGVNSSGKSSVMKAVGCAIIMAQCGLYVPAESFEYGIFDSLYTRISGNDNLFKGHSSFIIEMNELRTILKRATSKSLIIGDEICRGTEYLSANAIVASAIIKLIDLGAKFLFATHLHELAQMERIKNLAKIKFFYLSVDRVGDELIFSRKLLEGTGEQIYGITIAQYILDDPLFINSAIELKNELLEKSGINSNLINHKKSIYNKSIYMDACSICGSNEKLETHHINWQKDFIESSNGKIHKTKQHILKDSKANLVVLCDNCHDNLHSGKFTIGTLTKTTCGIKAI